MHAIPFTFAKAELQLVRIAKYSKTKTGCVVDIQRAATNLVAHLDSSFPPMFLCVFFRTGMLATGTSLHVHISVLAINRVAGNKSFAGDLQAVINICAAFLKTFLLLPSLETQSKYVWQAVTDLNALQRLWESSDDPHMQLEQVNVNDPAGTNRLEQTLLKIDFRKGLKKFVEEIWRLIFDQMILFLFVDLFIFDIVWAIFKLDALYLCHCRIWNWHFPISGGCVDISAMGTCPNS